MRRTGTLLLTGAIIVTAAIARGQGASAESSGRTSIVDVAITYGAQRGTVLGGSSFWQQGGAAEAVGTFYRGLGAVVNVGGYRAANIAPGGVNMTLVTVTFGPRYTWTPRGKSKLDLFAQGLTGLAFGLDSVFPKPAGAVTSDSTLAVLAGGGADWRLSRRFAVRPFEAEWLRTSFSNSQGNAQNNIRFSAGVVFWIAR